MKLIESYENWPVRKVKNPGFYVEWDENCYRYEKYSISQILGDGMSLFIRETNLKPTHISIGRDCRREVEIQTMSKISAPAETSEKNQIFGLEIIWTFDSGISLFYGG